MFPLLCCHSLLRVNVICFPLPPSIDCRFTSILSSRRMAVSVNFQTANNEFFLSCYEHRVQVCNKCLLKIDEMQCCAYLFRTVEVENRSLTTRSSTRQQTFAQLCMLPFNNNNIRTPLQPSAIADNRAYVTLKYMPQFCLRLQTMVIYQLSNVKPQGFLL